MNLLLFFYIPLLTAILTLIIPRKIKYGQEIISVGGSLYYLIIAITAFSLPEQIIKINWFQIAPLDFSLEFKLYHFAQFILIFLGLFSFLSILFSTAYFKDKKVSHLYYPFMLLTLFGASGIVLADNFFVLLISWEFVTLLLFFLVAMGQGKSTAMAAGKSFAILGFTDVAMLLAVIALPLVYGTWNISQLHITISDPLSIIIFLIFFTAAIAKAGAMPFHTWIPAAAENASLPIVAFLPASLDKLLGIYLLARICLNTFIIPFASTLSIVMMVVGAGTILIAVLIAVVQHDLKRLLSYHAISQVGYMVLGIGTGNPIGIAGGLFHMLNHAIYKSCLFFTIGSVERQTGTTDVDKLGGLARTMPITFFCCIIAALSISGVPPLNGFVSKWMIYQGLIDGNNWLFFSLLAIAMFGSALTLASFLKLLYGTFLGQPWHKKDTKRNEVPFPMYFTTLVLATLCILFGIFAQFPINTFIKPVIDLQAGHILGTIQFGTAFWDPGIATLLILLGIILGLIFFLFSRKQSRQVDHIFIGGEIFESKEHRQVSGNFYEFIDKVPFLGGFLREVQKGILDIYNIFADLGLILVNVLKRAHDGVLSTYLAWCIVGLGVISFILLVLP